MDASFKFPGSPGTPLHQVSPERVNQQRPISMFEPDSDSAGIPRFSEVKGHSHSRDSSVHDKISQFNTLAFQGKQLERKANDAALKRAMLGREEAESEMRRYRDETRALRHHVEEAKERERKVGERLETVMVRFCFRRVSAIANDSRRKITDEQKRPTRIHKHYGRRRFGGRGKNHLNHSQSLSSYRKSSSRLATL